MFLYLPAARAVRVTAGAGTPSALLDAVSENDSSRSGRYRCRTQCCTLSCVTLPLHLINPIGELSAGCVCIAQSWSNIEGVVQQQSRFEHIVATLFML